MCWFPCLVALGLTISHVSAGVIQRPDCPKGDEVNCLIAPCEGAKPPECNPDATCKDNYCGGCFAVWQDENGKEVDCDKVKLDKCAEPDEDMCAGLTNLTCSNPCGQSPKPTCAEVEDAVCIWNTCGGCNAVWVDSKGNTLPRKCQCIDCGGRMKFKEFEDLLTCADIVARGTDFLKAACNNEDVLDSCCLSCKGLNDVKGFPSIC